MCWEDLLAIAIGCWGINVPRDLAPTVQNFNGRRKRRLSVRRLPDLCKIPALFEHTEWRTESQIANDVESQVVEPVECIHLIPATLLGIRALVPLLLQLLKVVVDVLLELADRFRREGVRDSLALAGVLGAVAGVEEATADGDEGVIVFTVSMSVLWLVLRSKRWLYLFSIPLP